MSDRPSVCGQAHHGQDRSRRQTIKVQSLVFLFHNDWNICYNNVPKVLGHCRRWWHFCSPTGERNPIMQKKTYLSDLERPQTIWHADTVNQTRTALLRGHSVNHWDGQTIPIRYMQKKINNNFKYFMNFNSTITSITKYQFDHGFVLKSI